jgi:hypothetical protein
LLIFPNETKLLLSLEELDFRYKFTLRPGRIVSFAQNSPPEPRMDIPHVLANFEIEPNSQCPKAATNLSFF